LIDKFLNFFKLNYHKCQLVFEKLKNMCTKHEKNLFLGRKITFHRYLGIRGMRNKNKTRFKPVSGLQYGIL